MQLLAEAQRRHAQRAALMPHRQAPPLRAGQGVGEAAGRLAVALGPVGGVAVQCTETGGRLALALFQPQPDLCIERTGQRTPAGLQHLTQIGRGAELAGQRLQRVGVRIGRAQGEHLAAQARGQAPGHQGGDQEQAYRHHALARTDVQGETRFDEEEVVGDKTQQCGDHRRGHARARGHQHHRNDEHHRQVIDVGPALDHPGNRHRGGGSDGGIGQVVTLQPLAWITPALARAGARIARADDDQFVMCAAL